MQGPSRVKAFNQPEQIAVACGSAWFVAAAVGTDWALLMASLIGSGLCLRWYWGFFGDRAALVHMLPLGGVSLIAIMNLGFAAAWAANTLGLDRDFADTFDALGVSFSQYAVGVIYVIMFAGVLAAIGRVPPFKQLENKVGEQLVGILAIPNSRIMIFVMACILIDLAAYGSGILRFRQIVTEGAEEGKVAWFLPFLQVVFAAQVFLNALMISRLSIKRLNWSLALLTALSLGTVMLVYFSRGRSAFMMALALHFIYWCFFTAKRPKLKVLLPLAAVAYLVVPQALVISNTMRNASVAQVGRGGDVFGTMASGYETMQDEQEAEIQNRKSMDNLTRRPLVAVPVARCIMLENDVKNFMLGANIVSSVVWVIPG